MKLKHVIVFVSAISSGMLILSVHNIIKSMSFSWMRGAPVSWIVKLDYFHDTNLATILISLSIIFMIALIVMIRRAYTGRLNRLFHVAVPVFIAIFIYVLLEAHIDVYFHEHDYIGFLREFFLGLPQCLIGRTIIGLILFLFIMLVCYPVGILIDKLLLYLTSKTPKHSQG